jgi:hypothetical protein
MTIYEMAQELASTGKGINPSRVWQIIQIEAARRGVDKEKIYE